MVKIFNAFKGTDPLAATLESLGKQMFGNGTDSALKNEELYAAQRENVETDNLMRRIATGGGAQALGADPIAQAIIAGSGFDPSKFGDIGLMGAANQFGAADPRTQNWQVGTGQPFDNTAGAFNIKAAETARNNDMASADRRYDVDQNVQRQRDEFNNKPMPVLGVDGQPTYAPQSKLSGGLFAPILSDTEQKGTLLGQNFNNLPALNPQQQEVLGARVDGSKSSTPRNYIVGDRSFITYDGVTDAQTNQPLPPGGFIGNVEGGAGDVGLTNSTLSGVQQQVIANTKFGNMLNMTRELARRDPTNFGIPGFIKGTMADVVELANGIAVGLGNTDAQQAVAEVRRSAAENGVSPSLLSGVFDPNQAGLQTAADLLVYAAAEALAGQSGRSVSDKDVHFFKSITGDPSSWMMSQARFLAKLDQLEQILTSTDATLRSVLGDQSAVPAGQPAHIAPQAPVRFERGPDGRPVRVQ